VRLEGFILQRYLSKKFCSLLGLTDYHGNTQMVTEVSPASFKTQAPPEYVFTVPVAEVTHRGDRAADWLAEQVRTGIQTLEDRGFGCAALLVDPIFSSDGIYSDSTKLNHVVLNPASVTNIGRHDEGKTVLN